MGDTPVGRDTKGRDEEERQREPDLGEELEHEKPADRRRDKREVERLDEELAEDE